MNENELDREVDGALRRRFTPPARLEERVLSHARALAADRGPSLLPWQVATALVALAAGVLVLVEVLGPARDAQPEREAPVVSEAPSGVAPSASGSAPAWIDPPCAVGPLADSTSLAGNEIVRPDLEKIYDQASSWSQTGLLACAGERWCSDEGSVCLKPEAAALLAGPFSSEEWPTGTLWTGPIEDGSPVLVADLDATYACCLALELPEGSALNVFTWRVDDMMLTEITPRGEPRLLDCFEPTRVR